MQQLRRLLSTARERIKKKVVVPLSGQEHTVLTHVWNSLVDETRSLLRDGHALREHTVTPNLQNVCEALCGALSGCMALVTSLVKALHSNAPAETHTTSNSAPLRLGCGNPSNTGCMNVRGTQLHWTPITHNKVGVMAAMHHLRLDAVGLPAARLPRGVRPPRNLPCHLDARGGPSHHSTAVARSSQCSLPFSPLLVG